MSAEYSADVIEDLHAMVSAALHRWGFGPGTAIALLNLSENATFLLRDPEKNRELVLRVHRVGYSTAAEIRSELAWIQALRNEAVIETAAPLAGVDGEWVQRLPSPAGRDARHAVAFERLPGREPDAGGDAAEWFEKLGALTAKLHVHARQWTLPAGFVRKRWDVAAMVGPQGHWGPWQAAMGLEAPGAAIIETAVQIVRQRLESFGSSALQFGLVHADFRLANLLVQDGHLRIIDFDDCGFSWFLYDFATSLSFIEHEAMVPLLRDAWVTGYRSVAPLSADDWSELPTFVILRRILLSAWLASHREIPFAQRLGSAFTRETVRLAQEYCQGKFLN